MSKFFVTATSPEKADVTYGPFPKVEEALLCRQSLLDNKPTWVIGEVFSADDHYADRLPRPVATITRGDGSLYVLWSDGTHEEQAVDLVE